MIDGRGRQLCDKIALTARFITKHFTEQANVRNRPYIARKIMASICVLPNSTIKTNIENTRTPDPCAA